MNRNLWYFRQFGRLTFFISRLSRQHKLRRFYSVCNPQPTDRILDVGVAAGVPWSNRFGTSVVEDFFEESFPWPSRLVVLSLDAPTEFKRRHPTIRAVQGDGGRLPFLDDSFDIVFS